MDDFLRKAKELALVKEPTALIAYLNASGYLRKGLLAEHQDRQEQVQPTRVYVKETPLFLVRYTVGTGIDERAVTTVPNNLDFKIGRVRHNFSAYQELKIVTWQSLSQKYVDNIHINRWNTSTEDDPVELTNGFEIWKHSDTAFGFNGSNTNNKYLHAIYGKQLLFYDPSRLQFQSPLLDTLRFYSNTSVRHQLPAARGGTPPYTYSLEGPTLPAGLTYDASTLEIYGTITGDSLGHQWVVTDAEGSRIEADFDIELAIALTLTGWTGTASSPTFAVDVAEASGGIPPYTYSVSNIQSSGVYGALVTEHQGRINFSSTGSFGSHWWVTATRTVQDSIGQIQTATLRLSKA